MPFPPFPDLPDDNPILAVRMFRDHVRTVTRYVSPYSLLASGIVGPTVLFAIGYLVFGFDTTLSWASDLVPLTFAVISVLVSVKKLRDEHQTVVVAFVLTLGLLGSFIMHFSRRHEEIAHHDDMEELGNRVQAVGDQNNLLLRAYLEKPPITTEEAELQRRKHLEDALRGEYILSHDHVGAGMLAGTEYPPVDWMNRRLGELGEKWAVGPSMNTMGATATQPARSYIVFGGNPEFPRRMENGVVKEQQDLSVGHMLFFNYTYKATGPDPVGFLGGTRWLYLEPDASAETESEMIKNFEAKTKKNAGKTSEATWMPGQSAFDSAEDIDGNGQRRIITQEDLDALHSGRKIAYVVVELAYKDTGTLHHSRLCIFLQPPAMVATAIWHYRGLFNNAD